MPLFIYANNKRKINSTELYCTLLRERTETLKAVSGYKKHQILVRVWSSDLRDVKVEVQRLSRQLLGGVVEDAREGHLGGA